MPLLGRKEHQPVPLPDDLKEDELVFVIPYTGEIFREYDHYLEKAQAYGWPQWSCSLTGKSGLTFEDALKSEQAASQKLTKFPETHVEDVLRSIHHVAGRIEQLIEDIYDRFRDEYLPGEVVTYTAGNGKSTEARIVRVVEWSAAQPAEAPAASIANGDSNSDDEPIVPGHSGGDGAQSAKVKVAVGRRPAAYEAEVNGEVQQVSASHLARKRHPLPRPLLKKFIRDATRRDPYPGAPFIVKDSYVEKYGLSVELPEQFKGAKAKYDEREEKKRRAIQASEERELEAKRQKTEAKEKVKNEQAKYPMEDTLLPRNTGLPARPKASTDFAIGGELLGQMLCTWHFLYMYSKTIALARFSLDDYEKALLHDDANPLYTESLCALLAVLVDAVNEQRAGAVRGDEDEESIGELDPPTEHTWGDVLQAYIDQQPEARNAALLPLELRERRHMDEVLTTSARLALIQFLCDEVAQTDVFRAAVDGAMEDIKTLDTTRRQEKAEFRKLRKMYEDELNAIRKAAGQGSDSDGSGEDDEDSDQDDGDSGDNTPSIQVDEEGRASRRAMLEYKKMMKVQEDARREAEREQQRKALAVKNAEQRAEGQVRKKLQQLKADEEKKEAKYQEAVFRLQAAIRHQPLGMDRDHTAYWWLSDTARLYCDIGENRWAYIDNPEELEQLYASLDVKGVRECHLSTSLARHYRVISNALKRRQEEAKRDEDNRRSNRIQTKTKEMGFAYYVNTLRK